MVCSPVCAANLDTKQVRPRPAHPTRHAAACPLPGTEAKPISVPCAESTDQSSSADFQNLDSGPHVWQLTYAPMRPAAHLIVIGKKCQEVKGRMTVSMRVMSAGQGYRYLLSSVVTGDGDPDGVNAVTGYYAQKGTPPGHWQGSGLSGLAGDIVDGDTVTEDQLRRLIGHGQDPSTGERLGRAFPKFASAAARARKRIDSLPVGLSDEQRAARVAAIEAEENAKVTGTPVAGFDMTFSAPKSVSALWAVADGGVQALIGQAHHAAIADVLALCERDVAMTRAGATGPTGSVAQVEIRGVIATAYDHYDSRTADPQLHTHVVISNRVQAVHDGKWRTLDSKALHGAIVGLSEHYNAVLTDHLAQMLGVGWEERERGEDRNAVWEIAGVPQTLLAEFSSRSRDIELEKDHLIAEYVHRHGRQPSTRMILKLRHQATLTTRPDKTPHSLRDLTARWRTQAATVLGEDPVRWVSWLIANSVTEPLLRADDIPLTDIAAVAESVVAQVGMARSTWRRWNLHAETVRQTMGLRFGSTQDREAVIGLIVDAAEQVSIRLTPPELASSPVVFQRGDGSSVFRPKTSTIFSSDMVLAAEDRLLAASAARAAPTVSLTIVEAAAQSKNSHGYALSQDQTQAIVKIALSARTLDVLVGPAGTGKTTTMNALRRAWEREHAAGSVVGLAPSATAAQVLADDLNIACENTAKWLHEHRTGAWNLRAGQLVIIDEASLAGTLALDKITSHAAKVGAKVLLVGDWAQLAAVDAGGAFGMIVRDRGDAPELLDVRRFRAGWERTASLQLRLGEASVIETYLDHGRVIAGAGQDTQERAYQAWKRDGEEGKRSILIAETRETVTELNIRARTDRVAAGQVTADGIRLQDGTTAGQGDTIITRHNERRLGLGKTWVKNGDTWTVLRAHNDGALTVRRTGSRWGGVITLPATYVSEHVDLGYAITTHRAQGCTVDTAHAIVHSAQMTREALYVSMTRGRHANTAYVDTDQVHLEEHQQRPADEVTARSILCGILQHDGAEKSAHDTIRAEQETWSSFTQLAAEYDTIAQTAQANRWVSLLETARVPEQTIEDIIQADSFGVLTEQLRRFEADGHDVDRLVTLAAATGGLDNTADPGSVLCYRLQRIAGKYVPSARQKLVAGLIPTVQGTVAPEMRQALNERAELIEQRVTELTHRALLEQPPWIRGLGNPPKSTRSKQTWTEHLRVIVAYRDRYAVTDMSALGDSAPSSDNQRLDLQRAATHLIELHTLSSDPEPSATIMVTPTTLNRDR